MQEHLGRRYSLERFTPMVASNSFIEQRIRGAKGCSKDAFGALDKDRPRGGADIAEADGKAVFTSIAIPMPFEYVAMLVDTIIGVCRIERPPRHFFHIRQKTSEQQFHGVIAVE